MLSARKRRLLQLLNTQKKVVVVPFGKINASFLFHWSAAELVIFERRRLECRPNCFSNGRR